MIFKKELKYLAIYFSLMLGGCTLCNTFSNQFIQLIIICVFSYYSLGAYFEYGRFTSNKFNLKENLVDKINFFGYLTMIGVFIIQTSNAPIPKGNIKNLEHGIYSTWAIVFFAVVVLGTLVEYLDSRENCSLNQ